LTTGTARWQVAVAHCLASTAPGIVAWLCISTLELAASRGRSSIGLAVGTCVAVGAVSAISWACGVFVSRASVSTGWLLVMSIPSVARVASPLLLFGASGSTPSVGVTMVLTVVASAAAFVQIVRGETRLEAAQ